MLPTKEEIKVEIHIQMRHRVVEARGESERYIVLCVKRCTFTAREEIGLFTPEFRSNLCSDCRGMCKHR